MPEVSKVTGLSKSIADLARDLAYVAVGLGVLAYQRAQVQRVELQSHLAQEERLAAARAELTRGIAQLDDLLETATQLIETSIRPLEEQLPTAVTQLTTKALDQSREVRSQIRQRTASS
ncbi:MAG: hypothetical protein ACLQRH_13705 [Acidimicrobiales bacterium]|jgi:hypothetical protein